MNMTKFQKKKLISMKAIEIRVTNTILTHQKAYMNNQFQERQMLVTIFRDFFASEVQQEKLGQMLATNEQRQQAQLRGRHKGNKAEEDAPVIPYKISLFTRIFTKLRAIFCHN